MLVVPTAGTKTEFKGNQGMRCASCAMDKFRVNLLYLLVVDVHRWGIPLPIDVHRRVGDLLDGEQAYALGEALTGLDPADVRQLKRAQTFC